MEVWFCISGSVVAKSETGTIQLAQKSRYGWTRTKKG